MGRRRRHALLQPFAGHGREAECLPLHGGGRRKEGENEQAHDVVNDGGAQNNGGFGRGHVSGVHQRSRGNGDARGGQRAAQEASCRPGKAEEVPDAGAQQKWPDHAGQRHHERRDARFPHAIDIGFNAGDEHQD